MVANVDIFVQHFLASLLDFSLFISDPVEFCTSNDRRTGKPIAIQVTSIDISQAVPSQLSDEQFVGTVIQEAKPIKGKNVSYILSVHLCGMCV